MTKPFAVTLFVPGRSGVDASVSEPRLTMLPFAEGEHREKRSSPGSKVNAGLCDGLTRETEALSSMPSRAWPATIWNSPISRGAPGVETGAVVCEDVPTADELARDELARDSQERRLLCFSEALRSDARVRTGIDGRPKEPADAPEAPGSCSTPPSPARPPSGTIFSRLSPENFMP
jgi:hypothetical protein